MCNIKIIYNSPAHQNVEFEIRIDKNNHPSMEIPYYVVVNNDDNGLRMEFAYAKNTTQTEQLDLEGLRLIIGENTGRIFSAYFERLTSSNINGLRTFVKTIKQANWDGLKLQNFRIGVEILETIVKYFKEQLKVNV